MSSAVRSPGVAGRLAGLTSLDLVWRVPALTPGDGAGIDVVAALVGLSFGLGDVGPLEVLTTWLLLGYVAAVLAPRAYPDKLGVPAGAPGYRVLFATATVVVGLGLRQWSDDGSPLGLLALIALVALTGAVALAYLRVLRGWTLSPEDDRFVTLIGGVFPASSVEEELREDFARPGLLGVVGAALARAAAGTVVAFPAFLSGIVVLVLIALYPLPDLLVLGWAGLLAAGQATSRDVSPQLASVDVEASLYDTVEEATRNIKGTTLAVYLLALAFGFGLLFAVAFRVGGVAATEPVWTDLRLAWGIGGFLLVLVASSCYGIWCCIRMTRRLPAFLRQHATGDSPTDNRTVDRRVVGGAAWQSTTSPHWLETDLREHVDLRQSADTPETGSIPRRPVGTVVPPLVVAVLASAAFLGVGPRSWVFALVWPVLLLALAACLVWTVRRGRQSLDHDDHALVAGVAAFVVTVQALGTLDALLDAADAGTFAVDALPFSVYVAAMLVWFGYLDDAFRYAERHEDIRRLAKGGYLLAFTVVFGVLLPFTGGPYTGLFAALLPVAAVGGLALLLTSLFRL